jgi:hypothetical protein
MGKKLASDWKASFVECSAKQNEVCTIHPPIHPPIHPSIHPCPVIDIIRELKKYFKKFSSRWKHCMGMSLKAAA